MSTPRRDESGHGGSIVPINRPRDCGLRQSIDELTAGLVEWELPGTTMRGWTEPGHEQEAMQAAQASIDAVLVPGECMRKLRALVARFGEQETAKRIGIKQTEVRRWMVNEWRQPGQKARNAIAHAHYSAKL